MKKLSLKDKRELAIRKHPHAYKKGLFTREQIRKMNKNNPNYVDDEMFEISANAIQTYQDNINYNVIAIGKTLFDFKEEYKKVDKGFYKNFLKDPRVNLSLTQSNKYISVYKFSLTVKDISQLTDDLRVFGLEKVYMLMHIENQEDREHLKVFINKRALKDRELQPIIKDIKNEGLTLKEAIDNYWKRLQMKKGIIPRDENLIPRNKVNNTYTKRNYEHALAENQYLKEKLEQAYKIIECYKKGKKPDFQKELPEVGTQKLCQKLNKAEKILEFTKANEKACIVPSLFPQILKAKENNVKELQQKIIDKKIANRYAVLRKEPALVKCLTQELINTEYVGIVIGIMLIKCQTSKQTMDDYITSLKKAQSSGGIIPLN